MQKYENVFAHEDTKQNKYFERSYWVFFIGWGGQDGSTKYKKDHALHCPKERIPRKITNTFNRICPVNFKWGLMEINIGWLILKEINGD